MILAKSFLACWSEVNLLSKKHCWVLVGRSLMNTFAICRQFHSYTENPLTYFLLISCVTINSSSPEGKSYRNCNHPFVLDEARVLKDIALRDVLLLF